MTRPIWSPGSSFGLYPRLFLAGILALTVFISACGDDATPSPTPTATRPAATATVTQPAATASPTTAAPTATRPAATGTPTTAAPTSTLTVAAAKVPVAPRLKVAIPTPAQQQSLQYRTQQTSARIAPMYDYLVGHHYQTNVEEPQLATSWAVASDGKTWTWKLKQGVPFYKAGKPFNNYTFGAKDVIHTIGLLTGVNSKNALSPGTWSSRLGTDPSKWVAVSDSEVRLDLPFINLDMSFLLSDEWETGILSKQHWDAVGGEEGYAADPIGNGAFTFVNLQTNVGFLHQRVDNHWRKTPEFLEFQGFFIRESATRLAMLITGEAHVAAIPRDLGKRATDSGMVRAKSTLPGSHTHLRVPYYRAQSYVDPATGKPPPGGRTGPTPGFDPNSPMRNVKVRLALNLAINRAEINQVFFQNEGFPLVDYFPPWRNDFKDAWAPVPGLNGKTGKDGGWPYPYDPAKAKQLLTEAGYPNGFDTELWATPTSASVPEQADIVETIKKYWEAIGVRTKLTFFDGSLTVKARQVDSHNWSFFSAPSLDPICVAPSFWWYEGGVGYVEYEEVSTFKKACDVSTDPQARIKLAQDFGDWWTTNAISVPLVWVFNDGYVNPAIVAEYKVNMVHMGPIRYHEYTKAVTK